MKKLLSLFIAAITCSTATSTVYADFVIIEPEPVEAIEEVYEDPYTPSERNPLIAVQADNMDSIILKRIPDSSTENFTIYIYDNKKEKYCKYSSGDYDSGRAYIEDTVPETEYKILVRKFDYDGNIIFSEKVTVTTGIATPTMTICTDKKAKVTWKSNSNLATGYELYAMVESAENYYSYVNFSEWSYKELEKRGFRLIKQSDETASGSIVLKTNKDYSVIVRTFYFENGEKIYSSFSHGANTASTSSYVNALKLSPKTVCSGDELKLVKKYVDSVITDDMTNYEKLEAIFKLVNSHGTYQNDINKIDGNRPVWQIMEKQEGQCASWAFCLDAMLEYAGFDVKVVRGLRSTGQQHFWCQMEINGKWYDIDAHVGYFLVGPHKSSYLGYEVVETF